MIEVSRELVDRMTALVRKLADAVYGTSVHTCGLYSEARAIVAKLPQPVDPDLLTARGIVAHEFSSVLDLAESVLNGKRDHEPAIRIALAALKSAKGE